MTNRDVIIDYLQVLAGKKKAVSVTFFTGTSETNQTYARVLFSYAAREILHLTPEEFLAYLRENGRDGIIKIKLLNIVKYIVFPDELDSRTDWWWIAFATFKGHFRYDWHAETIDTYKRVLHQSGGRQRYPHNFFDGPHGRYRAAFCLIFAMNQAMQFVSVEDIYSSFSKEGVRRFLTHNRLDKPLDELFDKNPVSFVHFSISEDYANDSFYIYYSFIYSLRTKYVDIYKIISRCGYNAKDALVLPKSKFAALGRAVKSISASPKNSYLDKEFLLRKASERNKFFCVFLLWFLLKADLPNIENENFEIYEKEADTRDLIKGLINTKFELRNDEDMIGIKADRTESCDEGSVSPFPTDFILA